jgi:hypothetical protein
MGHTSRPWSNAGPRFVRNGPSLSLVCKQIHHESKPYLCNIAVLSVEIDHDSTLPVTGEFGEFVTKLEGPAYNLSTVRVLEVDSAFLTSMEAYYWRGDREDGVTERAQQLFLALETVVVPSFWYIDHESTTAVRGGFGKPGLKITAN